MRIDQLTFTRFVAAMAIVVYHFGREVPPFNNPHLASLVHHANLGVSYFYILSGFVMMVAYYKKDPSPVTPMVYYKNRLARIYPLYFIALLLVVSYYVLKSAPVSSVSLLLSLPGLQAWYPPSALQLNYPGWSISVELFFYILFPWLFNRLYLKYSFNKLLLLGIAVWFLSQLFFNGILNSSFYRDFPSNRANALFYFPLMHLNEFLVGNLAGLFVLRNRNLRFKNADVFLLLLMLMMAFVVTTGLPVNFHNGLLAIFIVPFLILLSLSKGVFSTIGSSQPLQFLGDISYGIYILQVPVYLYCYELFTRLGLENYTVLFYLYCIILIVTSAVFYKVVEKPLRDRIRNHRSSDKIVLQTT